MKRLLSAILGLVVLFGAGLASAGNMTFAASNPSVTTTVAVGRQNAGTLLQIRGVATFSASYAAGGDTLPASVVGLGRILWVDASPLSASGVNAVGVTQPTFAAPSAKVALYALSTGTQVTGDQSAQKVNLTVWGY